MTIANFDPRLITQYNEPRFLIHFQWGNSEKVYRYALVESMEVPEINLDALQSNTVEQTGGNASLETNQLLIYLN